MEKKYTLIEVHDKKSKKAFIRLPVWLYRNDKTWIRPLDNDVERIFDPGQNKYFQHGECTRWILNDSSGQTVGRVAAFIDNNQAFKHDQPTGGMGFFECINDKEAAFALFDQCMNWLKEKGMEAMDGPVNFGERHQWWGLLIEGFSEPNYCTPYNFSYYRDLFEAYGFKLYFRQYTYHRRVTSELQDTVRKKAEKILTNHDYTFRHLDIKQINRFTEDFRTVYNKGWIKHTGVNIMSEVQAKATIKKLVPILDERLVWFAYYNHEPVAFFIMLPEVNQIIKHLNGKMDLVGKLKYYYHKKAKTCKKVLGMLFGVVPEQQGKGVEAAIVVVFANVVASGHLHYIDLEMNWIGDFHPKMMHVAEQVGGKILKTHITYRYLFNPKAEFKRAPMIS
jgi:hypothetical protein